jgi:hypothetical protein
MEKTIMKHFIALSLVMLLCASQAIAGTYRNIAIDGDLSDWTTVPDFYTLADSSITTLKIANNTTSLFFMVELTNAWSADSWVMIDSDTNAATGFNSGWMTHGYDWMFDAWNIYSYSGSGPDWTWTFQNGSVFAQSGYTREVLIPMSQLGHDISSAFYPIAHNNPGDHYMPAWEGAAVLYEYAPIPEPAWLGVSACALLAFLRRR